MITGVKKALPATALLLSLGALAVPSLAALGSPRWMEEGAALLVWMSPLLPAFLLAYHRGWAGAALALATGMASLAMAQVAFLLAGAEPPEWHELLAVVGVYLLFAFGIGALAELLRREREQARELALLDSLTHLPNRRHALLYLDAAFAGARRGGSLAVVLFDLDRFKKVNDRHGHGAGDAVLKAFGELLGRLTRRSDLSARFGGEEFLSILPDADEAGARAFGERVREALGSLAFPWGRVTTSAGVALYQEGMGSVEVLLAAADRALYRAKEEGRDRLRVMELVPFREDTPGAGATQPPEGAAASAPDGVPAAGAGVASGAGSGGPARAASPPPPPAPAAKRRVALVDDDPGVARVLGRALEKMGYEARAFQDPRELLKELDRKGWRPHLLLTDVVMPGMSGMTLVEELDRRGVSLPVVYMSGYVHGEITWPGIPGSVTRFLEKPVSPETLQRTLEEALAAVSS